MQNSAPQALNVDSYGFTLTTPEEGLQAGKRRLAQTFRRDEQIWLVAERYDPVTPSWLLDIVRQGQTGRWVRQRYRFDTHANVLHFLGESALSDADFRAERRAGQPFPVAEWQEQPS
jgi:hypothetical protein